MSHYFKKIKNVDHSLKYPPHFQEIMRTFSRIDGDIFNTYWRVLGNYIDVDLL